MAGVVGPLTKAYTRLWVLHQLLMSGIFSALAAAATNLPGLEGGQHYFSVTASNHTYLDNTSRIIGTVGAYVWIASLVALAVRPKVWLLVACHTVAMYMHVRRLPFLWDFELWDLLVEACIVLAFAADMLWKRKKEQRGAEWLIESSAMPVKLTVVGLYAYTVFWKLTSSFFGPMSCGPIFTLSLLDAYTPASFESGALVWLVGATAPHVTVIVEAAIPFLLWVSPMPLGLLFGSIFHVLIAISPPPNNAAIFSVSCIIKFWFFCPEAISSPANCLSSASRASVPILIAVTSAAVHLGVIRGGDWGTPISVAVTAFYVYASTMTRRAGGARASSQQEKAIVLLRDKSRLWLNVVMALLTFTYGLVLPVLGVQDMGASTMFANLYVFSGSNHMLGMPTGILFPVLPELAGGVVRVDWTDSSHFNGIHPHEKTQMHSKRLSRWLRQIGHTARQFGPYSARVVGAYAKMNDVENFQPFLIPFVELRRLAREASAEGEAFTVRYTKLGTEPALSGNGTAEADAGAAAISVSFSSDGSIVACADGDGEACSDGEIELLLRPLSRWAEAMLGFFSFPVPADGSLTELGCVC